MSLLITVPLGTVINAASAGPSMAPADAEPGHGKREVSVALQTAAFRAAVAASAATVCSWSFPVERRHV